MTGRRQGRHGRATVDSRRVSHSSSRAREVTSGGGRSASQGGNINPTFFVSEHRGDLHARRVARGAARPRGNDRRPDAARGRGTGTATAGAFGRNTFADLRNY